MNNLSKSTRASPNRDLDSRHENSPNRSFFRWFLASCSAACIYILLSFLFFVPGGTIHDTYIGTGADPLCFIWALNWWPWSLAHGMNPFVTKFIWYPTAVNLAWVTSVPTAAFFALPITLLWGAVESWNVLSMLAPVLSALSAFLLTRYLTCNFAASLFGGYLFGFSTYEIAQSRAHLNLDLVLVPPLLIWAALARLRCGLTGKPFVAIVTVLLLAQMGLSTEIFATSFVFGAMTWLIFFACAKAADRRGFWHLAWESSIAAMLAAVIASPFLYYVVVGAHSLPDVINPPEQYSTDLVNFLIPTPVTRLGSSVFASIASRFTGNFFESSGYLGLPLIMALAGSFRTLSRHRAPLAILFFLFVICSLGPSLWIDGVNTHVWLPWRAIQNVPVIRHALPARFTLFVFLVAAVAIALWLAEPRSGLMQASRYTLAAIGCLFLLPSHIPWTRLPVVPFFTSRQIASAFPAGENVIILPFGETGAGLIWQVEFWYVFHPNRWVFWINANRLRARRCGNTSPPCWHANYDISQRHHRVRRRASRLTRASRPRRATGHSGWLGSTPLAKQQYGWGPHIPSAGRARAAIHRCARSTIGARRPNGTGWGGAS